LIGLKGRETRGEGAVGRGLEFDRQRVKKALQWGGENARLRSPVEPFVSIRREAAIIIGETRVKTRQTRRHWEGGEKGTVQIKRVPRPNFIVGRGRIAFKNKNRKREDYQKEEKWVRIHRGMGKRESSN